MIDSFEKYKFYLAEDKKAMSEYAIGNSSINPYLIDLELWNFQKSLRKCEYLYNCNMPNIVWRIRKYFAAMKYKKLSVKLGFTIPVNCFGPGLRIMHRGTIVVNGKCKIGAKCTINACVNIGANPNFENDVPMIGNNVYIGPGAKIFGGINIADGCRIGANAVVNRTFSIPNSTIVGVPAVSKNTIIPQA